MAECKPKTWFEADPARLVREYDLVRAAFPEFELSRSEGIITWNGQTGELPAGVDAVPLKFTVEYPSGFPIAAIKVRPISPELPAVEWGHEWHRWSDGRVCIVKPRLWDISYTAADVIEKVADWYFNYLAYKHGLITKMPDAGRASLTNE